MEGSEKEVGRSFIGISIYQDSNGKIKPRLINKNFNIPVDIIISQLKFLQKMLEDNHYPRFKGNTTIINLGSEE